MNERIKKLIMLTGILCMLSLAVYGCGGTAETEPQDSGQAEEPYSEEEQQELPGNEPEEPGESGEQDEASEQRAADQEELAGEVQEIGEGQFTVARIYQETLDDGAGIMIVGAPGNEKDMGLITVSYDDDAVFYKRTIWDGGAKYEDSDASPADLVRGFTTEMKGSYEGEIFHASEIQIVEVIFDGDEEGY